MTARSRTWICIPLFCFPYPDANSVVRNASLIPASFYEPGAFLLPCASLQVLVDNVVYIRM